METSISKALKDTRRKLALIAILSRLSEYVSENIFAKLVAIEKNSNAIKSQSINEAENYLLECEKRISESRSYDDEDQVNIESVFNDQYFSAVAVFKVVDFENIKYDDFCINFLLQLTLLSQQELQVFLCLFQLFLQLTLLEQLIF